MAIPIIKPTVGSDDGVWGGMLNTALDALATAIPDTAKGAAGGVAGLDSNGNLSVTARIVQVGPTHYGYTDLDAGGPNSAYVIVDKANTASDASIVLRDQGAVRAEVGIAGDDDLHVKTAAGAAGSEVFTDRLIVKANGTSWFPGKLGVGTVPAEQLQISKSEPAARVIAKIENANSGAGSKGVEIELSGNGVDWGFGTDAGLNGGNNFFVQDNVAGYPPRMLIDTNGNIGVGTDSPTTKLDVHGNAVFTGSVGFNGTAPVAKPTVTGSRGGNAAVASLLTALASLGLITDSTSA